MQMQRRTCVQLRKWHQGSEKKKKRRNSTRLQIEEKYFLFLASGESLEVVRDTKETEG